MRGAVGRCAAERPARTPCLGSAHRRRRRHPSAGSERRQPGRFVRHSAQVRLSRLRPRSVDRAAARGRETAGRSRTCPARMGRRPRRQWRDCSVDSRRQQRSGDDAAPAGRRRRRESDDGDGGMGRGQRARRSLATSLRTRIREPVTEGCASTYPRHSCSVPTLIPIRGPHETADPSSIPLSSIYSRRPQRSSRFCASVIPIAIVRFPGPRHRSCVRNSDAVRLRRPFMRRERRRRITAIPSSGSSARINTAAGNPSDSVTALTSG